MMKKSVTTLHTVYGIDIFQKLNDFLEAAFNEGLIKDGLVATDLTKAPSGCYFVYTLLVCVFL